MVPTTPPSGPSLCSYSLSIYGERLADPNRYQYGTIGQTDQAGEAGEAGEADGRCNRSRMRRKQSVARRERHHVAQRVLSREAEGLAAGLNDH